MLKIKSEIVSNVPKFERELTAEELKLVSGGFGSARAHLQGGAVGSSRVQGGIATSMRTN
jgi:hypothetical protein